MEAVSMLPQGGLPHTYEPTPQQMKLLSKADIYVRIGVEFEQAWRDKMTAANPTMHIVDSAEGVDLIEADAHEHLGRDPHIWLSPRLVKIQAENIYRGLIAVDPDPQGSLCGE